MRIITTRRISQAFFFTLFLWFCITATPGGRFWQLRGWPVNWFLELDPLIGLGVLLATHTLYAGLLWGVLTLVLTFFFGRFFCGWICPMGAVQQVVGFIGQRKRTVAQKVKNNQPHWGQRIKYWLLIALGGAACADLLGFLSTGFRNVPMLFWSLVLILSVWFGLLIIFSNFHLRPKTIISIVGVLAAGSAFPFFFPKSHWLATSLQFGLFDPIALIYRSVNLVLLPWLDGPMQSTAIIPRFYQGGAVIGMVFVAILIGCLRIPRFYCRFICPLGALLGLCSRWAVFRIRKTGDRCRQCQSCEAHCEGACAPSQAIQINECVLCLNCLDQCRHQFMGYGIQPSVDGERLLPDLSRRQVVTALVGGLVFTPFVRTDAGLSSNWNPYLIRPPGALPEAVFLSRCIKCGQCMRICPTNVLHPAGLQAGFEGLWTPVLNFRIGTSGCQHNCVACSHICPTAALRPISVDERMGRNAYSETGPLRMGMAFVDRGRCLAWAMDTPCIVCQENCPVSPKAIFTRVEFRMIRGGQGRIRSFEGDQILLEDVQLTPGALVGGDYFLDGDSGAPRLIVSNTDHSVTLLNSKTDDNRLYGVAGEQVQIKVRLQQPYVDPRHCIGCGVCEHECPVQGRRAIRVSGENASRQTGHRMVL